MGPFHLAGLAHGRAPAADPPVSAGHTGAQQSSEQGATQFLLVAYIVVICLVSIPSEEGVTQFRPLLRTACLPIAFYGFGMISITRRAAPSARSCANEACLDRL